MMLPLNRAVTQRDVTAHRDNIGGSLYNNNSNNNVNIINGNPSPISAWMEKLADEIRGDVQVQKFIDTLQFYHERHSHDGIDGLEDKLTHADRVSEIGMAIRKKELFTRLLAKYSMFDSAQQIFAYLLSKIEHDYKIYVLPNIKHYNREQFDQLIHERLVTPAVEEASAGVFSVNAAIATGMVYWLAEQCYVRWHA